MDKSSLSTDVQHDEPRQTTNTLISNQEIKKDVIATVTTHETFTTHVHDLDLSNHAAVISTNDSDANKHATEISTQKSSSSEIKPTSAKETFNTQIIDSNSNKQSSMVSTNDHGNPILTTKPSTSQIHDSDANKQTNVITTHDSPKLSTSMVPTSNQESNIVDQTNHQTVNSDTKQATNESTQSASTDLQTNKDDDHGNPLPTVDEPSTSQVHDSDTNKQTNMTATHDSPKSSTSMVPNSNQDSNFVDQTNLPTVDSDTKHATNKSKQSESTDLQTNKDDDHGNPSPTVGDPSTSQVHDLDANNQANVITTHDSPKNPTSMVPTSNQDSNFVDQTNLPTVDSDTKHATNKSKQSESTDLQTNKDDDHGNPSPTVGDPSTSQVHDLDANNQANMIATHDSPKNPTSMVPTSNQDSNFVDQTNLPTVDSDTKHATNKSKQSESTDLQTNKDDDDHRNPSPTVGDPSTSQVHDLDANNQSNVIVTHDSPKSPTSMIRTSNQDTTSIDQTNPPTIDNDTKQATNESIQNASTNLQTNKDDHENPPPDVKPSTSHVSNLDTDKQDNTIASQDSKTVNQPNSPIADSDIKKTTDQSTKTTSTSSQTNKDTPLNERKHLVNLIGQELKFVEEICPKLGKHEEHIRSEAQNASEVYKKLKDEPCELKDLKDLKKTVTKLKLQIPARYRTYDKSDKQKNQQSDAKNKGISSSKLLKKLPRLHDKNFRQSPLCKAIHLRFKKLSCTLKLCLLCFTVFPENAIISRRSVIYLWIGEGLIPTEDDIEGGTVEDCANDLFKELMDMGFIEPHVSKSYGRNVAMCKMNSMVRAALVMIAEEVKFFDFDAYGDQKDFGKFDEIESPEDLPRFNPLGDPNEFFDFFDGKETIRLNQHDLVDKEGNLYQFVSLNEDPSVTLDDRKKKSNDTDEKFFDRDGKQIDKTKKYYFYLRKEITTESFKVCLMGSGLSKGITWEKLHMLFNVKDDILEFKPEWFLRMKNLNVLFLGRWQSSAAHHIEFEEFEFEKSLDNMKHVRFFSLQGVSRISKLPESISKLQSLLILDLRACHNLDVIPETIGSLRFLTHLDISECYLLKKIPKGISSLESLQVLKGFVVVESPGKDVCTLQDLKKLENLRKLNMYTHMKDFPQDAHLDALQKFDTLRKLTILWGGHESESNTPKTNKSKQDNENKKKGNLASKVTKLIQKKKWVEGSMRRMNAFGNSTFGGRLEKLDLKCFPHHETPDWLTPGKLKGLKKLYIRGGNFSDLGQYQDILQWDDSSVRPKETWNVEILRLKYLEELNMEWRELQDLFPKLASLEKVKCPRLTLFPCNEHGVWIKKGYA